MRNSNCGVVESCDDRLVALTQLSNLREATRLLKRAFLVTARTIELIAHSRTYSDNETCRQKEPGGERGEGEEGDVARVRTLAIVVPRGVILTSLINEG